ncbi:hypothetical protein [Acanthopleuribacter pedis]|uniref:Uncharacterized protein n=1 Tax=Acanthopleuribacter pedis TaxID=442870 RepID=A0A8J7QIF4_9BACT|nr:hypothetical protein [Acanthopleuribacter pedis]MBO1320915.1 hypothetical protein [Acanthopleuribacter pedis]
MVAIYTLAPYNVGARISHPRSLGGDGLKNVDEKCGRRRTGSVVTLLKKDRYDHDCCLPHRSGTNLKCAGFRLPMKPSSKQHLVKATATSDDSSREARLNQDSPPWAPAFASNGFPTPKTNRMLVFFQPTRNETGRVHTPKNDVIWWRHPKAVMRFFGRLMFRKPMHVTAALHEFQRTARFSNQRAHAALLCGPNN